MNNFWYYDYIPKVPGIYSVLICYDPREGAFPDQSEWTGIRWDRSAVVAFSGPYSTRELALDLAQLNDPDL